MVHHDANAKIIDLQEFTKPVTPPTNFARIEEQPVTSPELMPLGCMVFQRVVACQRYLLASLESFFPPNSPPKKLFFFDFEAD
jgi:hypothetical protein